MDDAPGEPLARGYWLEGLSVAADGIWYTDVLEGGVRPLAGGAPLLPERTLVGGLLRDAGGALLVGGDGGIAWADPATGATGVALAGIAGANEMTPDRRGGLYVGEIDLPAIRAGARPGPSAILHMDARGTVRRLREGMTFANGLALGPDNRTLFVCESFSAVRAFPVAADGSLGEPRTLADKRDCDGMALDAEGNIWVTGFASDHLLGLSPEGREIGRVGLPGGAATSLRFGGADMRDAYVTLVEPADAAALTGGGRPERARSTLHRFRFPVAGAPAGTTALAALASGAARG